MSGLTAGLIALLLPVWWGSLSRRWLQVPFWAIVAVLAVISRSWTHLSGELWAAWLLFGLVVGEVAFLGSLLVLGNRFVAVQRALTGAPRMIRAHAHYPAGMLYYALVALSEELVVRVVLQAGVLGGGPIAVLVTSFAFAAVHWRPGQGWLSAEIVDLFLFSCLMGVCFDLTHSLPLVVAAHLVRNLNAAYVRRMTVDRSQVADPGVHCQEA